MLDIAERIVAFAASIAIVVGTVLSAVRTFVLPYDPQPAPSSPISVTREEFDAACERLAGAGVPLKPDRDQSWRDFAGWRVNYDTPLLLLATTITAPPALWSSDRAPKRRRPPTLKLGK